MSSTSECLRFAGQSRHKSFSSVPVYNEEGNISRLYAELVQICSENGYSFGKKFISDSASK